MQVTITVEVYMKQRHYMPGTTLLWIYAGKNITVEMQGRIVDVLTWCGNAGKNIVERWDWCENGRKNIVIVKRWN